MPKTTTLEKEEYEILPPNGKIKAGDQYQIRTKNETEIYWFACTASIGDPVGTRVIRRKIATVAK